MQNNKNEIFYEKIIKINRVSKVVTGGRKLSFVALVIIGNYKGRAGFGIGKAKDASAAIEKAIRHAKMNIINIQISSTNTFCKAIRFNYKNMIFIILPSQFNSGIRASKYLKPFLSYAGIKNGTVKIIGAKNPVNTYKGLVYILKNILNIPLIKK